MTDKQPPKLPRVKTQQQGQPKLSEPAGPNADYAPMDGQGFSHILSHLLRKPLSIIHEINKGHKNPVIALFIITLSSLAVFGFALGIFSSGQQLWMAPAKVIGGVLFSGLICLPSLYIFGCLDGMDAKIHHVAGLMLTFLAITSMLLVGFAPVVWLFSTSSNSLIFFGVLGLLVWLICLIFGLRVISQAARCMGGGSRGNLKIWIIIFILVTLQMTTTLRPILGTSDKFINLEEKHFFLGYWFKIMADKKNDRQTSRQPEREAKANEKVE